MGRKYRLGRKFNSGSFGDLYLGSNVQTGEEVAVKLEPMRSQYPQLVRESKVYKAMAKEGDEICLHSYCDVISARHNFLLQLVSPA